MVTQPLPWTALNSTVPVLDNPCNEETFPYIQAQPPLKLPGAISSCPVCSGLLKCAAWVLRAHSLIKLLDSVGKHPDRGMKTSLSS